MPRKTRRIVTPPSGASPIPTRPNPWRGYALTAAVAAALGAGVTYAVLRPTLQAAHAASVPSPSGTSPSGLAARGNTAFDAKDWSSAIADYTQAIAGGLDNPDIRTDLGTAYHQAHQPQKALEQDQIAQREDPHHENSLLNQAVVYAVDLNDPAKALMIWQQYLTRFPHGRHVADVKKLIATVLANSRPSA